MRKSRKQLDSEMEQRTADGVPAPDTAECEQPASPSGVDEKNVKQSATSLSNSLQQRLSLAIESLLFVSGEPMTLAAILEVVHNIHPELTSRQLRTVLDQLRQQLREQGRGVRLAEVAGGFQLRTPSEAAPYLRKLVKRRPPRMTRATLETLAIVAYRQPVTRAEVEQIRGVDCGAVLRHLLDKQLVKIIGRKDEPGRPLLYGTTRAFLEFFSLKDLQSLPTLKDFAELSEEARQQLGIPEEQAASGQRDQEQEEDLGPLDSTELAPPGDDAVVQELATVLTEVNRRDRQIRREILAVKDGKQSAAEAEQHPAAETPGPPTATAAQPAEQNQPVAPPGEESTGGEGPQQ